MGLSCLQEMQNKYKIVLAFLFTQAYNAIRHLDYNP